MVYRRDYRKMIQKDLLNSWPLKYWVLTMLWLIGSQYYAFAQFDSGMPMVQQERLMADVEALAHDSMLGRLTGTAGAALAADYIAKQFASIGLKRVDGNEGNYKSEWSRRIKRTTYKGENVAGVIPGTTGRDTMIIFSAHYDHIGVASLQKALPFGTASKFVKGDSIFNGANDNATGVAALLELARIYAAMEPVYTIMFVAFSGEELGLFGSSDFTKWLNPKLVKLNLNLEMLGRPLGVDPFLTQPGSSSSILDQLNKNLFKSGLGYPRAYFAADPYPEQNLFYRSDNYSFYRRKIAAHTIMASSPYDDYYHSAADDVTTIEWEPMTKIVQAILVATVPVVMGR